MMDTVRYSSLRSWSALVVLAVLSVPALAAQRVALLIGNASYAHAPPLANPANDAADIGAALGRLGFSVTKIENAGYAELRRGLLEFQRAASASEMAVVFYAGHGIEVDQRNFLVPVDARLASDRDVEYEAVPLGLVQRAVERASGLRLVILDACRENPFAARMQRVGATRSIGRGLARVEPTGETLVAYAAKGGTVALDGTGRNSPYTRALLAHLEKPGLEVMLMLRNVRDAVLAATGGQQEPFWYGSLSSRGVYLAAAPAQKPSPPKQPSTADETESSQVVAQRLAAEREFWNSVKDSRDPADVLAYLGQFPGGIFEPLARNRLKRLENATEPTMPPVSKVPATPKKEPFPIAHGIPDASLLPGAPTGPSSGIYARANGALYRGEYLYGKLDGRGTYTWADGARYKGRFREGKMHGTGTYTSPDGHAWTCKWRRNEIVSGTCEQQLEDAAQPSVPPVSEVPPVALTQEPSPTSHRIPDPRTMKIPLGDYYGFGEGTYTGTDGSRYEGSYFNGTLDGTGTYTWADGARYEGKFRNSKLHGRGTYTSPDGLAWTCKWRRNEVVSGTCE